MNLANSLYDFMTKYYSLDVHFLFIFHHAWDDEYDEHHENIKHHSQTT